MLDIEKRIDAGTLDPSWLLEYDTPVSKGRESLDVLVHIQDAVD